MTTALLESLARSFRATQVEGRTVHHCPPFIACLAPTTDAYLMSVATPTVTGPVAAESVAALDRLFAEQRRHLRLEFFAELHPGLDDTLKAAGAALDMEAPVMALTADGLTDGPAAGRCLTADDLDAIAGLEQVQAAAYGDMLTPDAQEAFRPMLVTGLQLGAIRAAVLESGGETVAAAMLMLGAEAAELAGVATRPDLQGHGHASALCRLLLREFFARESGMTAWLSAGPDVGTLYSRLGFRTVGTQLNMGRKPG